MKIFISIIIIIINLQSLYGENLILHNRINPSNHELLDVEIEGNLMMVPGGLGGVGIFNLNNLQSPQQLSSLSVTGCDYGRTYNWEIGGNYAYGAGRDCGIAVVDISNPVNPFLITLINGQKMKVQAAWLI